MKISLYAPVEYWVCEPELREKITGGCGPGGIGDLFIPDTMYGLNVKPACEIHDFYYGPMMPATIECKEEADRVFLNNLIRIIEAKTQSNLLAALRKRRARTYYHAVKTFGGPAFWKNKNLSENFKFVEIK